MGLFKPDLYRSFLAGFALGTAVLLVSLAVHSEAGLGGQVIPAASAAPSLQDQTLLDPATTPQR